MKLFALSNCSIVNSLNKVNSYLGTKKMFGISLNYNKIYHSGFKLNDDLFSFSYQSKKRNVEQGESGEKKKEYYPKGSKYSHKEQFIFDYDLFTSSKYKRVYLQQVTQGPEGVPRL